MGRVLIPVFLTVGRKYSSKRQSCIAMSSTEAEIIARRRPAEKSSARNWQKAWRKKNEQRRGDGGGA